jgi:transcriptional regulator with XRE-family HTH domain
MNTKKTLPPYLIALKELREKSGKTYREIADALNYASDKPISRIFTGEAKKPDFLLVSQIIHFLGGSVSHILGEGGAYIVNQDVATLQAKNEELADTCDRLFKENELLKQQNLALTDELRGVVKYFTKAKE